MRRSFKINTSAVSFFQAVAITASTFSVSKNATLTLSK